MLVDAGNGTARRIVPPDSNFHRWHWPHFLLGYLDCAQIAAHGRRHLPCEGFVIVGFPQGISLFHVDPPPVDHLGRYADELVVFDHCVGHSGTRPGFIL